MNADHLIFMFGLLPTVLGLPDGPPTSACVFMRPGTRVGVEGLEGHTTSPQNFWPTYGNSKTPPYFIQIHLNSTMSNTKSYKPGQQIHVSVVANQTYGSNMYKGLLLQVRHAQCASNDSTVVEVDDPTVGTFILPASSETLLKTMACGDIPASAVCHKSPQYKINETVTWRAPDTMQGNLVFRATIVQHAHIYWTEVHSEILRDPNVPAPPVCGTQQFVLSTGMLWTVLLYWLNRYWFIVS